MLYRVEKGFYGDCLRYLIAGRGLIGKYIGFSGFCMGIYGI